MNICQVFYRDINLPFASFLKLPYLLEISFFFLGIYFLINFDKKNSKVSLLHAFSACLLLLSVYSNDFILWRTFFFPVFFLSIISNSNLALKLLATCVWCLTAGSLSFFGALVAILLNKGRDFYILILGLFSVFFSARAELFDYPHNARFVPLSFKFYNLRDIFGLSTKYDFIDSITFRELSIFMLLSVLIPFCLYLVLFLKENKKKYFSLALIISSVLLYKVIHKLIPGISLLPFSWDLYLILLTVFLYLSRDLLIEVKNYSFALLIPLCLLLAYQNQNSLSCIDKLTNQNTPSNFVSKYWKGVENIEYLRVENVELLNPIEKMLDSDSRTRWSTGSFQKGGEQLSLDLKQEISLSKIKLNTGVFLKDFPRGLKVVLEDSNGNKNLVFNKTDWLGPLKFTKLGYTYFGNQSDVEIAFDKSYKTKKIILTQTSKDRKYDWSIAELELYRSNIKK